MRYRREECGSREWLAERDRKYRQNVCECGERLQKRKGRKFCPACNPPDYEMGD